MNFLDYLTWAISEAQPETHTEDTAEEKRKVRSLMRKRGLSEGEAIAILKSSGAINRHYGNEKRKK